MARLKTLLVAAAAVTTLVGCGNLSVVKADGTTDHPVWPNPNDITTDRGAYPEWQNSHELVSGMTKEQLLIKLGPPHFHEGLFNVREWDYVFHYQHANQPIQCQLKILFDNNFQARTFLWKPVSCSDTYQYSTDMLFGASDVVLTREGRRQLGDLARTFKTNGVEKLNIRAYADRQGLKANNLELSRQRAQAVAAFMAEQGFNQANIKAFGLGQENPLVTCDHLSGQELIDCLAPNRRVVIEPVK